MFAEGIILPVMLILPPASKLPVMFAVPLILAPVEVITNR